MLKPKVTAAAADEIANRANALANVGRVSEALLLWQQASSLVPERADFQLYMGHSLTALGQKVEAEAAYREAVRLSPHWLDAHITLANFLGAQGRSADAIKCFSAALVAFPKDTTRLHLALAKLKLKGGDVVAALDHYGRVASLPATSDAERDLLLTALRSISIIKPMREKLTAAFARLGPNNEVIATLANDHLSGAHQRQLPEAIQPSPYWQRILSQNAVELSRLATARAALLYMTDAFNINMAAETTEGALPIYDQTLKAEFPQFSALIDRLECSPYLAPDRLVVSGGKLVSSGFFAHLRSLLVCLTWLERPSIVCEIGGGYGGLATLWMSVPEHKPDIYILIDFPQSLFFAEVFIRANDPTARLLYLTPDIVVTPELVREYDYVLCPSDLASGLEQISLDVVVNMFSFQEMTEQAHAYWMSWLDKMTCRFLYSLNIFGLPASSMDTLLPGCAMWSPRPGPSWVPRLQNAYAAPMYAYGQPLAEMIFEKNPADPRPFTTRDALVTEIYQVPLNEAERIADFARRWSMQSPLPREVDALKTDSSRS